MTGNLITRGYDVKELEDREKTLTAHINSTAPSVVVRFFVCFFLASLCFVTFTLATLVLDNKVVFYL